MRLLIAGGGTGGHLFPGIAIAEETLARHPDNGVVFVGTQRGLEAREIPRLGYPLEFVDVVGLKGKGIRGLFTGLWRLPRALLQSLWLLRQHRPDVVLGVGGYASGPVLLAAWLLRIPLAIQEQNAVPGLTNRLLGRLADAIFTAFPEARLHFPSHKVFELGNPIRRALMDNFLSPRPPAASTASSPEGRADFSLLVLGGSQGAHRLNQLLPEALKQLPEPLRSSLRGTHQAGATDREAVEAAYRAAGLGLEVRDFVVDMSAAYRSAQLVICRAGASTLAELAVCQKAAILVPFPAATDDHQTRNARALVAAGAALLVSERELTPQLLADRIVELEKDPVRLRAMEVASGRLGRPEAAREITEVCFQLASRVRDPGQRAQPTRPEL